MISLALWSTQDCLAFVGHISHNLMPCSVTHSRMLKEGSSDVSGSPTWESTSTAGPRQSTGYFPSDTGVTYTIKMVNKNVSVFLWCTVLGTFPQTLV